MKWLTKDANGNFLCNFAPKVLGVDAVRFDGVGERILRVKLCIDVGENNIANRMIWDIPLEEIDKICWKKLNIRCRYHPEVSESKVRRYLGNTIRDQMEKVPRRLVEHLTHTGMYKLDEHLVFCTGKAVVQDPAKKARNVIEIAQIEKNLEVDEKLSEEEAAAEFLRLLSLSPDPARIISAYKLGFFMRPAYERIGKVPKGCIFLYGRSGTQKTTYSSFLVQTYDRSKGIKSPSRLNASIPAAVNMLLENSNDVVVMDDLFPADSKKRKSQQEEILIEITRYVADGTVPAKMRGKEVSQEYPKCGVIFTGEYLIGRGSDAARLLPVEMTKPDTKKLRYFQEHPLIVSTFYRNYITWFIYNYDEICNILEQLQEIYENNAPCVHDRLREMYFFLGSSYFLFLQYLFEKKLLSESEARRLYQSFDELIVMLIKQQNEQVIGKRSENLENEDYLQQIRMLYKTGQMSIARDAGMFDKKLHDGLLHNNRLYLRGDRLSVYFPESTIEEIADSLEAQGALDAGKKSRTKQISSLNGMRFYVILLNYLK